jgi:hypothetical protein
MASTASSDGLAYRQAFGGCRSVERCCGIADAVSRNKDSGHPDSFM